MKIVKTWSLLAACMIWLPPVSALNISEAVDQTLRTNPDVQASRYNVEAAEQQHKQAKAGYLPSVDLMYAGGRENSNNTTTRALGVDDLWQNREDRSIKLTQLLYDGMATPNHIRQQEALVNSALSRLASTQENIGLQAVQVYLELLRRSEVVRLTNKNLNDHESTLSKIQDRFDNGVGTKVDVIQTIGRRAQAKSNLLLSEREVKNGQARFYRVVGIAPVDLVRPGPIKDVPTTLQSALEMAYRNNPTIKAAEADLEAAISAHKQTKGLFQPRFDLEVGATRNHDTDGTDGANDDETAVIRMSYNVFHGGADRARMNEAEAREFAARESLRGVKLKVQEDVTVVWNELEDILTRLEYLQAHVASTDEVLIVYNEQLGLGKRSLLDLLDVQNEQLRARITYLTGEYNALLARFRVMASIGGLLDTLGVTVEK